MSLQVEIISAISQLKPEAWDALTDGNPLLSHRFLSAMEHTHCVGSGTGWQPYPLIVQDEGKLVGAVPLYAKSHSYGEYVFDWSWAHAFEQHHLPYYPKLISAIPFTPITGPRLLSQKNEIKHLMADVLSEQLCRLDLSSCHVLFPDETDGDILEQSGWLKRHGVQFRWENEGYDSFEAFLMTLTHDKRKKIRQERRRIREAGVRCQWLTGSEITEADWHFFYQCYENTYRQHQSTPYLSLTFFLEIARTMPEHLLLIVAEQAGNKIAAALNLYGEQVAGTGQIYGRYWGATSYVPGLHFELSYYQAQAFCITRGLRYFEGGAQGEHKLARGFKPRPTSSYHKIAHPDFAAAIEAAVQREAQGVACYQQELEERAPYKQT